MPAAPLAWLSAPYRLGQRLFWRPAVQQPMGERSTLHPNRLGPFSDCARLTHERNAMTATCVVALLPVSDPADILRRVMAVIVDAIQRVLRRRPSSNVADECLNRRTPLWAHLNPARSIEMVVAVCRILATTNDIRPQHVFRRLVAACRKSMAVTHAGGAFALEAATALRHTSLEIRRHRKRDSATFTKALPVRFTETHHWTDNTQTSKNATCEVDHCAAHTMIIAPETAVLRGI